MRGRGATFGWTVKPGTAYRELGNVIQKHADAGGVSVVRTYTGHGVHTCVEGV